MEQTFGPEPPERFLIVTADDFGASESVNEAVQRAYERGVLRAASLMVGAPAAAGAIRLARRLPGLRVGLHLVLADGEPILPPRVVPALLDRRGRFSRRMFASAVRFVARPAARAQLAAEIRAQYQRFADTGLALDHVNAHKHFHLHPLILGMMLRIGRDFGLNAVRLPSEAPPPGQLALGARMLTPWIARTRKQLDRAGIRHNDHLFGLSRSGRMDEAALLEILRRLPEGTTEIYLHPAVTSGGAIRGPHGAYRHADELAALLSPRVRAAVEATGAACGGYSDLLRRDGHLAPARAAGVHLAGSLAQQD